MNKNSVLQRLLCMTMPLMLLATAPVMAAEEQESGKWQWYGELFALGAQLDGAAIRPPFRWPFPCRWKLI